MLPALRCRIEADKDAACAAKDAKAAALADAEQTLKDAQAAFQAAHECNQQNADHTAVCVEKTDFWNAQLTHLRDAQDARIAASLCRAAEDADRCQTNLANAQAVLDAATPAVAPARAAFEAKAAACRALVMNDADFESMRRCSAEKQDLERAWLAATAAVSAAQSDVDAAQSVCDMLDAPAPSNIDPAEPPCLSADAADLAVHMAQDAVDAAAEKRNQYCSTPALECASEPEAEHLMTVAYGVRDTAQEDSDHAAAEWQSSQRVLATFDTDHPGVESEETDGECTTEGDVQLQITNAAAALQDAIDMLAAANAVLQDTALPEHQDAHERHEAALQAEADRLHEISQHIYGTIAANKAALDAYMAAVTTCNANGGIGDSSGRRHLQSGSCETDCSAKTDCSTDRRMCELANVECAVNQLGDEMADTLEVLGGNNRHAVLEAQRRLFAARDQLNAAAIVATAATDTATDADAEVVSKTADSNNAKQCMACIYATTEWPVADNCRSDCASSKFLGSASFTDCDATDWECHNDVQMEVMQERNVARNELGSEDHPELDSAITRAAQAHEAQETAQAALDQARTNIAAAASNLVSKVHAENAQLRMASTQIDVYGASTMSAMEEFGDDMLQCGEAEMDATDIAHETDPDHHNYHWSLLQDHGGKMLGGAAMLGAVFFFKPKRAFQAPPVDLEASLHPTSG